MSAASYFSLSLLSVAGVHALRSPGHGRARDGRSMSPLPCKTLIGRVANLACNKHPISAALTAAAAAVAAVIAVFPQPLHSVRAIQFHQQHIIQRVLPMQGKYNPQVCKACTFAASATAVGIQRQQLFPCSGFRVRATQLKTKEHMRSAQ